MNLVATSSRLAIPPQLISLALKRRLFCATAEASKRLSIIAQGYAGMAQKARLNDHKNLKPRGIPSSRQATEL